jgi:hypothetical protein
MVLESPPRVVIVFQLSNSNDHPFVVGTASFELTENDNWAMLREREYAKMAILTRLLD